MTKADSDIQQAVLRELKWDTRVEEIEVGVQVDAGVVTKATPGVRTVEDRMLIEPSPT